MRAIRPGENPRSFRDRSSRSTPRPCRRGCRTGTCDPGRSSLGGSRTPTPPCRRPESRTPMAIFEQRRLPPGFFPPRWDPLNGQPVPRPPYRSIPVEDLLLLCRIGLADPFQSSGLILSPLGRSCVDRKVGYRRELGASAPPWRSAIFSIMRGPLALRLGPRLAGSFALKRSTTSAARIDLLLP